MEIHGLEPASSDPAFAFCVLRLRQATARNALLELLETLAPLIPEADTVIEDLLPEDLEQAVLIIAVPWQPPLTLDEASAQRQTLTSAAEHGVEEVWCFQTNTALPPVDEDGDDDDADLLWSNGPPPQVTRTRFPVDGTEDPDTADFGIAVKLAGEILPGEGTVLLGFHTLWLAPYGGRYRNASVTIDRKHHAAHFWVDRFEAPCDAEELVGHLLWIVSKLDEVTPVVHARIAEATLTQKYGELMGEEEEPFVLGGNPVLAAYALNGEAGVDAWIAEQTTWSNEEVAQMLREVAVEIVTADDDVEEGDGEDDVDADDVDSDDADTQLGPPVGRRRRASEMRAVGEDEIDDADDVDAAEVDTHVGRRRRASAMRAVGGDADEVDDADDLDPDDIDADELGTHVGRPASAMRAVGGDADVVDDADDVDADEVGAHVGRRRRASAMRAVEDDDIGDIEDDDSGPSGSAYADITRRVLGGVTDDRPRAKGTRPMGATSDDDDLDVLDDDGHDDHDHGEQDDRGRAITTYAAEILRERAKLGRLDPRVVDRLVPMLGVASRFEARRHAAIDILGAARSRAAVGPLIEIARSTKPDAPGKSDLLVAAVTALGDMADPAAGPVLVELVAAEPAQYDVVRAVSANALVTCRGELAIEARAVDALLRAIRERGDAESHPAMLFATGRLARLAAGDVQARAKQALVDLDLAGEDPIVLLAREGALVMLGDSPTRDLKALLHECLTSLDYDQETTAGKLRVALQIAELVPYIVDAADLTWLTCFVEGDIRARAHALLVRLGKPLKRAPVFDRYSVRGLGDDDVIELMGEARVVGRAALVAEAARRKLVRAVPAIIDACHDIVSRARHGAQNLLDPDTRTLEAAVPFLRRHLDAQVISLFDRMLRHPNYHVKWELMQAPPVDERLIAGMFHVLGERWGWQEETAKEWLANFQGTPEFELERRRVPTPAPYVPDDQNETNDDDQDMN